MWSSRGSANAAGSGGDISITTGLGSSTSSGELFLLSGLGGSSGGSARCA